MGFVMRSQELQEISLGLFSAKSDNKTFEKNTKYSILGSFSPNMGKIEFSTKNGFTSF